MMQMFLSEEVVGQAESFVPTPRPNQPNVLYPEATRHSSHYRWKVKPIKKKPDTLKISVKPEIFKSISYDTTP